MVNKLKNYQTKRNFQKTPEPKGKVVKSQKTLHFCVQHHLARKDHYDFRLEWQGVLKSWAVPKGPSYNPQDKRLAIMVEDHPLSYRTFEGVIPAGEYGGGPVMLWDEGTWEPVTKIPQNFKTKILKFKLNGQRLKGLFTLVHFKDNNWLLIKDVDEFHLFKNIDEFPTSIKTKRTMEEIAQDKPSKNNTDLKKNIIENVTITSPDKVIFKRPQITKKEIALYYQKVAPRMLPFLKNRLVSFLCNPDGFNGEKFFKKHLNTNNPGIGKVNLGSKLTKKDYYYIKNTEGLIAEVQMNSYEFHLWGSTIKDLNHPDIMVFDLDPDEKLSLVKLRQGVRDLKEILDELGLKSYLKTSGGKGYHVVVPFKEKVTWRKFRNISKAIAELMETKWPDKYTSNIRKNKRTGRIFIDWIRNTKGATSVCPYSIRLRKKCAVSMPIAWEDLTKIKPAEITMAKALKMLEQKDPWADFFS